MLIVFYQRIARAQGLVTHNNHGTGVGSRHIELLTARTLGIYDGTVLEHGISCKEAAIEHAFAIELFGIRDLTEDRCPLPPDPRGT